MRGLDDFTGRWALTRQIDDAMSGQVSQLTGQAVFTPDGAGLRLRETGTLRIPGQLPLSATRDYLWRGAARGIAVLFADGRAFHSFDPGQDAPEARHDCAPDTYDVVYDFGGWPGWRATWRVRGPRKDYVMVSCYAPCAGAETQGKT